MWRKLALVPLLTFALALCVAASFYVVGGQIALRGPGVIRDSWPLIYAIQAVLVAAVVFAAVRVTRQPLGIRDLAVILAGAWLGQWLVLASGILADELNASNGFYYWLLATGGPLQPIAGLIGGLLAGHARNGATQGLTRSPVRRRPSDPK